MSLFAELKRRNVVRVGVAYIVIGWVLAQVAEFAFENFGSPEWVLKTVVVLLLLGLPLALFFAWAFEMTPEGVKREKDIDRSKSITHATGRKLDFVIIGTLVIAVAYFVWERQSQVEHIDTPQQTSAANGDNVSSGSPDTRSIAVLPFVNMSSDPEQEFFSDGISEELLNVLAQFPELRVAARTSSFQFKGMNQDVAEIAAALNVAHVLEGSVRKSGTKLRITAQLIKADDGFHVWSKSYDREVEDIFAVQDEIALAISDALKVQLSLDSSSGDAAQPAVIKAANTDAYEAYLRGRQLIHRRGRVALEDAVRSLELALRLDNDFAPAHAQLAIAIALLMETPESYGTLSQEEVLRRAVPHLDRAQELEPNLAEAYAGRALLALDTHDLDYAIQQADMALAINPSYIDALNWKYLALQSLGRYEDQETAMLKILELDPMTIIGRMNYIGWLGNTGRIQEGHAVADQLLKSSLWAGYSRHGEISLVHEAKIDEGIAWGLKAHAEDPGDHFTNIFLVLGFTWLDMFDEARRVSEPLSYIADAAEGNFDKAIRATQRKLLLDPDNESVIMAAANTLYEAGRLEEALPLFERARDFLPEGRPIDDSSDTMMRLALSRRKTGDAKGAEIAAQIAKKDHAAWRAVGVKSQWQKRTEATIAAFEGDTDGAITALNDAIRLGMRDARFFADPMFEDLWQDPRFVALQQELDAILIEQREKVLQMICFHNPAPAGWQPLPATCTAVVESTSI